MSINQDYHHSGLFMDKKGKTLTLLQNLIKEKSDSGAINPFVSNLFLEGFWIPDPLRLSSWDQRLLSLVYSKSQCSSDRTSFRCQSLGEPPPARADPYVTSNEVLWTTGFSNLSPAGCRWVFLASCQGTNFAILRAPLRVAYRITCY